MVERFCAKGLNELVKIFIIFLNIQSMHFLTNRDNLQRASGLHRNIEISLFFKH
jgi:hypothetical protein